MSRFNLFEQQKCNNESYASIYEIVEQFRCKSGFDFCHWWRWLTLDAVREASRRDFVRGPCTCIAAFHIPDIEAAWHFQLFPGSDFPFSAVRFSYIFPSNPLSNRYFILKTEGVPLMSKSRRLIFIQPELIFESVGTKRRSTPNSQIDS